MQSAYLLTNKWIDKEKIYMCTYIFIWVLFNQKEEWNCTVCKKTDGIGDYLVKRNKPDAQIYSMFFSHMGSLEKKVDHGRDEGIVRKTTKQKTDVKLVLLLLYLKSFLIS